jgi:uncharacterized protein Smg (DUF494 family)
MAKITTKKPVGKSGRTETYMHRVADFLIAKFGQREYLTTIGSLLEQGFSKKEVENVLVWLAKGNGFKN